MVSVSIIIVSWNTKDCLLECLKSVYKNVKDVKFEIIVVDNASSDGSIAMLRKNFPHIELVENKENAGFAKANNQAIKKSNGEYVLLLNPDTLVFPGSIDRLTTFMESEPRAGIAGPKLLNADKTPQRSAWKEFPSLAAFFISYFYLYKLSRFSFVKRYELLDRVNEATEVAHISGACMLIRKKAIDEVGLLDEQFYMYLEETDLCYRMREKGWKIYFLPEAEIIHYGQKSTEKNFFKMTQEGTRSYCKFFRKHFKNPIKNYIFKILIFIGVFLRMAVSSLQFIMSGNNYKKEKIKAYLKVLKELPTY